VRVCACVLMQDAAAQKRLPTESEIAAGKKVRRIRARSVHALPLHSAPACH
jgi:hypothetical protein